MRNKGQELRSGLSLNGRTNVRRQRLRGSKGESVYPIDRLLDEAEATVSAGVKRLCCELGMDARSFERAVRRLKDAAGLRMGEELFRQTVEREGKAALAMSNSEELEVGWRGSHCLALCPDGQEVSRVYASCDGVMVPTITQQEKDRRRGKVVARRRSMPRSKRRRLRRLGAVGKGTDQRYKQVYVSIFYDQSQSHRLVGVSGKDGVEGLSRLLRREAARICLRGAQERRGIVDGAVCLRSHMEVLPLQEVMLDLYHLSEHVAGAGKATLGESQAGPWVSQTLHAVRHEGYEAMFGRLLDWRGALRGHRRKEADRLINYVSQRQEMMGYSRCDAHGWDVGSGPMESMCGVTTDRIKGRGRRWNMDNAVALMELEALHQSNLWDRYCDKRFSINN